MATPQDYTNQQAYTFIHDIHCTIPCICNIEMFSSTILGLSVSYNLFGSFGAPVSQPPSVYLACHWLDGTVTRHVLFLKPQ
jgi:hypothetical protein